MQQHLIDVMRHYARGDLSVDMDRLPGEKAAITQAMDETKASLSAINAEIRRLAWSDAMCPAGLPDGAAAARWFRLVHLRMPADLRRDLFGTDRLSLSRAEALTGISRRTLKRHLPKGGWW